MAAPVKPRLNTVDYYRMAETGLLRPDARVELVDGVLHDMSPIGPFHGGVVARLTRHFAERARGRWLVWTQNPLHLDDYSEPEPDLLLLKPRPDDYTTAHPRPAEVLLLVEVADSSLAYDRAQKVPLYARAGIREVWLLDLAELTLTVFSHPVSNTYQSSRTLRSGEQAHPAAFPDVSVDLSELFRR